MIAVILVAALLVWGIAARAPEPEGASKTFIGLATVGTFLLTKLGLSVAPVAWSASSAMIALLVLLMAALPPLVGLAEGRLSRHGSKVYESSRFVSHLLANLVGAAAIVALVLAARRVAAGAGAARQAAEQLTLDVTIPLAVLIALAFAVAEQQRVRLQPERNDDITGYSLLHFHAFLNSLWLAITVFAGTSSVILLLEVQIATWETGNAQPIPWVTFLAVLAGMAFVLKCGLEATHDSATYVTFATGAPGMLALAVAFLARSSSSGAPFYLLALTIVIGVVLSVVLALRMERGYPWWVHVATSMVLMTTAAVTAVRGLPMWGATSLLFVGFLIYVCYVVGIMMRLREGLRLRGLRRSIPTHYWTAFLILSVIMLTVSAPTLEQTICPHLGAGDVCAQLAPNSAGN
ncbi:hypothetical protein JNB_13073 [Janibacter sp. HTCC2649]|uniref:hypothetical protein n=1 Tax=Janibacter sp. HTCC2649 TaxID=313589 RepID=UPI00006719DC|nr:hypothetical protein [Janibacter sp. HTCC2649]EAP97897.1 hypothetical protein JNB_13073 [Janibacter sp. HTCC2649]